MNDPIVYKGRSISNSHFLNPKELVVAFEMMEALFNATQIPQFLYGGNIFPKGDHSRCYFSSHTARSLYAVDRGNFRGRDGEVYATAIGHGLNTLISSRRGHSNPIVMVDGTFMSLEQWQKGNFKIYSHIIEDTEVKEGPHYRTNPDAYLVHFDTEKFKASLSTSKIDRIKAALSEPDQEYVGGM